jgi:hypothetical protein
MNDADFHYTKIQTVYSFKNLKSMRQLLIPCLASVVGA